MSDDIPRYVSLPTFESIDLSKENAVLEEKLNQHKIELDGFYETYRLNTEERKSLKSSYSDLVFMDMQNEFIEILKHEINGLNLQVEALELVIKHNKNITSVSKVQDILIDAEMDIKNKMIEYQTTKLEKYKIGTKNKSENTQNQWALAQCYFTEEIPKHKTLMSARKAAAKRAGITVKDRRLIEMLPVVK
jgi:hypothetical protein